MAKPERELLATARRVAQLQLERRKIRRRLRQIEQDLKVERRHLRALASIERDPDVVPLRQFGPGMGVKRPAES